MPRHEIDRRVQGPPQLVQDELELVDLYHDRAAGRVVLLGLSLITAILRYPDGSYVRWYDWLLAQCEPGEDPIACVHRLHDDYVRRVAESVARDRARAANDCGDDV